MYNCVPDNSNISGFCPQMMIAYSINFKGDRHSTAKNSLAVWDSPREVGQLSVFLLSFMDVTPSVSVFVARARKGRRRNEKYLRFFLRGIRRKTKKIESVGCIPSDEDKEFDCNNLCVS